MVEIMTIKDLKRLKALSEKNICKVINQLYIEGLPSPICTEVRDIIIENVTKYFEQEINKRS